MEVDRLEYTKYSQQGAKKSISDRLKPEIVHAFELFNLSELLIKKQLEKESKEKEIERLVNQLNE